MPRNQNANGADAIKLLTADHKEVKECFDQFEEMHEEEAGDERQVLAQRICALLTIHTQIEEELFYPAVRDAIEETDLIDEAAIEHASAKELIQQIEGATPDEDAMYDAKVKVLGEYVKHHVKEEEKEMFPKVRKSSLDLVALGQKMARRKQELTSKAGLVQEQPA